MRLPLTLVTNRFPLDDDVLNGGPTLEAGCYVIDDSVRISEGILVLEPGVTIVFTAAGSLSVNEVAGSTRREQRKHRSPSPASMTHEDIGKAFDSKTVTPRIIV